MPSTRNGEYEILSNNWKHSLMGFKGFDVQFKRFGSFILSKKNLIKKTTFSGI